MTALSDDVSDLRSGKLSLDELIDKWAIRAWAPMPSVTNAIEVNEIEADRGMGGDDTWDEVVRMRLTGVLSPNEYTTISESIELICGRKFPPYVEYFQQVAETIVKKIKPT